MEGWQSGLLRLSATQVNRKVSEVRILYPPHYLQIIIAMVEQTIESKVASAILEKPIATIELEGVKYNIAPPSLSTLILVSEIVSTLPRVENVSNDKIVYSALHHAKDFKQLGDIVAVLILGAKGLTETVTRKVKRKRLFGLIKREIEETVVIDRKAELSKIVLDNIRPSVMLNIIVKRLNDLEIGDFFGITTSLSEVNILSPTKEVGK